MTTRSNSPEILELIRSDHEKVQELFQQFQESREASRDGDKTQSISQQIFNELKLHTDLEEKIVYPPLKEQDEEMFYEAGEEHHVADLLISEMQKMNVSAPDYAAKMTVMQESVKHHIQEEESEIFNLISQLPDETLNQMAQEWKQQKQQAVGSQGTARSRA